MCGCGANGALASELVDSSAETVGLSRRSILLRHPRGRRRRCGSHDRSRPVLRCHAEEPAVPSGFGHVQGRRDPPRHAGAVHHHGVGQEHVTGTRGQDGWRGSGREVAEQRRGVGSGVSSSRSPAYNWNAVDARRGISRSSPRLVWSESPDSVRSDDRREQHGSGRQRKAFVSEHAARGRRRGCRLPSGLRR